MKNYQNKIQSKEAGEKKQWKIFGWFFLLFGILLLIDGVIKLFFDITWFGWTYDLNMKLIIIAGILFYLAPCLQLAQS
jgi:hypothetical protein